MKVSNALLSKSISFSFSQTEQSDSSSYRSFIKLSVKLEDWLMVTSVSSDFPVTTSGAILLNGSIVVYRKKNGLAKSREFVGMFDFLFPASRDQNKCTRKINTCS